MQPLKKLVLLTLIVVSAVIVAVIYHCYWAHMGFGYPYNTYLFDPADRWADFYGTVEFNEYLDPFHNTFRGFRANYPPFCYAILALFTNVIPNYGVYIYAIATTLCTFAFFIFIGCRVARGDSPKSLFLCIFLSLVLCVASYPFQFALDRMNAELLIFCLIALGFIAHSRKSYRFAAVMIGLAAAMKIYPGAFALIFLYDKRYSSFLLSAMTSVVATIVALIIFQISPFEVMEVYRNAAPAYTEMMIRTMPMANANTLFALVRGIQFKMNLNQAIQVDFFKETMKVYSVISALCGVCVLAVSFAPGLKVFERLILITSVILLVPVVSFDYKLLHLFIPMYFWLIERADSARKDLCYLIFFTVLLSPSAYKVFYDNVTSSTLVHIIVLSIMVGYLSFRSLHMLYRGFIIQRLNTS